MPQNESKNFFQIKNYCDARIEWLLECKDKGLNSKKVSWPSVAETECDACDFVEVNFKHGQEGFVEVEESPWCRLVQQRGL